jgi:hypothetical protein
VHRLLAISNMNTHTYGGRRDFTASELEALALQEQQHQRFRRVSKAATVAVGVALFLTFKLAPTYEAACQVAVAAGSAVAGWLKLVPGAWANLQRWSGAEGARDKAQRAAEDTTPRLAMFAWGSKVRHAKKK